MTRTARDEEDRLLCGECERPIGGVTGLQEIQNLIAHMAEHHDRTLDMKEALDLRVEWENAA